MFLRLGGYSDDMFFVMIYEQNIKEVKSLIFFGYNIIFSNELAASNL